MAPEKQHHRPQTPEEKRSTAEARRLAAADTLMLAAEVLGPQFDEDGTKRWRDVEDFHSLSGIAVTNGTDYFVYGPSAQGDFMGLKRVRFDEKGHVAGIATQAIRHKGEEYRPKPPIPKDFD